MPLTRQSATARWGALVARCVLAAVFLWAAVPKITDPASFAQDVDNYRLLPDAWVGVVAATLPVVELVLAASLLVGWYARGAALVSAALLAVFVLGMGQAMARGIDLNCGCFGTTLEARVGWDSVLRNVGLILLCTWVVWVPWSRLSVDASWTGSP